VELLIDVDADLKPVTDVAPGTPHDLLGELDLLPALHLEEDPVMDQHARHDAGLAQSPRRQPQHVGATALHREVVERLLVGTRGDVKLPTQDTAHVSRRPNHGVLHHAVAPLPEPRVGLLMLLDDGAGDQRVTIQAPGQRGHAHAVVDPQLQLLHALPHRLVLWLLFPMHRIRVAGQSADLGKAVIDVAAGIGAA
jgi:hypothetical protein